MKTNQPQSQSRDSTSADSLVTFILRDYITDIYVFVKKREINAGMLDINDKNLSES